LTRASGSAATSAITAATVTLGATPVDPPASARAQLAAALNELLDQVGMTQYQAAKRLGMSQPKVSAIRNYKLRGISLERLIQALVDLDQQVEIVVTPTDPSTQASGPSSEAI